MGPKVSFPLPPRIAKKLPIRNSWELLIGKLPIPLPMFYFFELSREAFANTLYLVCVFALEVVGLSHDSRREGEVRGDGSPPIATLQESKNHNFVSKSIAGLF